MIRMRNSYNADFFFLLLLLGFFCKSDKLLMTNQLEVSEYLLSQCKEEGEGGIFVMQYCRTPTFVGDTFLKNYANVESAKVGYCFNGEKRGIGSWRFVICHKKNHKCQKQGRKCRSRLEKPRISEAQSCECRSR